MRLFALAVAAWAAASVGYPQVGAPVSASGVQLTIQGVNRAGERVVDSRVVRTVALYVPKDRRPSPLVEPGLFEARWNGRFRLPQRDRYTFAFVGVGEFSLTIDGEPVAGEAVRLQKGDHQFEAKYASVAGRDAQVRLEWSSRRFAREPMPPTMFRHDSSDAVQRGVVLSVGRELVATRRCAACHAVPPAAEMMPELKMRGPDLAGAGTRFERNWLAAWLRAPRALRPDARMPHVLTGTESELARDAADLAAWLGTLEGDASLPVGQPTDDDGAAVELGGFLFADLGCIGCHQIGEEPTDDGPRPIDLRGVGGKFRLGALASFLMEPARHDPWTRMPDFDLSRSEAARLEAFLRTIPSGDRIAESTNGDAERGRERAVELRCAACHSIPGFEVAPSRGDLAGVLSSALDRGCLAVDASEGVAPDFGFDSAERAALRALGATGIDALRRGPPDAFAARTISERRCTACHSLDGAPDDWTRRESLLGDLAASASDDDGAEPAVAQIRPNLTWAGDKLRTGWLDALFRGDVAPPTRPWLRARMPSFSGVAEELAFGLAAMHGHGGIEPQAAAANADTVALGKTLVSARGGFACVTCHAVGETPPLAVFEVQGTNFASTAARLRSDFFRRWMWNPLRIDPNSRMPRYADDKGRTPFLNHLDGDARAQFDAIWSYFRTLR